MRHLGLMAAALALGASVLAQADVTVRVTAARANVRAEPNEKGAVITQVTVGTVLTLKAVEGDWFRVQLPADARLGGARVEAFISRKVASLVGAASDAPAPSTPAPGTPARSPAAPSTSARGASALSTPPMRDGMLVAMQSGGSSVWLTPAAARVIRIADRVDSARAAAVALPIGQSHPPPVNTSTQISYVWVTDQASSSRVISDPKATFAVQYKEVPGVSPDDFAPALVRLTGTPSGVRVVAAIRGRADQTSRRQLDWDVVRDFKYELVKTSVDQPERGVASLQPAAPLEPGEYAIVLRPAGSKKFAGVSVLSETGEGRALNLIWAFTVK
jgi:hypothetical protein